MKYYLSFILSLITSGYLSAQVVSISPSGASADEEITITYDATQGGEKGLIGASKVFMHSGVVLTSKELPSGSDWSNVVGNWGQDDGIGEMIKVSGEDDKWEIKLTPSARDYYSLTANENAFWLAMVFRNADGSAAGRGEDGEYGFGVVNGGDIFIRLNAGEFVSFDNLDQSYFLAEDQEINFDVSSSSMASAISVSVKVGDNEPVEIASATNQQKLAVTYQPPSEGNLSFIAKATINGEEVTAEKDTNIKFIPVTEKAPIPEGLKNGVNYSSDLSKATLVLLAPDIDFVYVAGDLNDWKLNDEFLMNRDTENEDLFWIELDGLEINKEYIYQYWVEGDIKIGDPYGTKVVDPYNDRFIPESVFPGLKAFTREDLGIATTLQTGQKEFVWDSSENTWEKPDKEDLVIYELLLRDFIGSHSYKDLSDTISYLKKLGINTIELMPIMEFEGNESWGYNPSYFFAPDKYYGTADDLKNFIQTAHQNGIAVVLDMVLNHAFGQNAMVRMHWDNASNTVSEDSPWFNQQAPHPFSVGFDFNHESQYTKDFVDDVNRYWIEEFHFDGYRFDLTKGFTQKQSDEGSASDYDQSRIDILKRMAEEIWKVDDQAYVILEHFASSSEENVLKESGMMTWGNNNHDFRQLLIGDTQSSFSSAREESRVSYMESHDEERIAWEMKEFGMSSDNYNVKNESVYLERSILGAAFFFTLPGPKMIWQFQELGYDVELNDNRLANKPLPWGDGNLGYYENAERKKVYEAYSAIIGLTNQYEKSFSEGSLVSSLNGKVKFIKLSHEDISMLILGNFDVTSQSFAVQFQTTGTWYDYFSGAELKVDQLNKEYALFPGEFHIFTNKKLEVPGEKLVSFTIDNQGVITNSKSLENQRIKIYPSPASKSIKIDVPGGVKKIEQISFINVNGKEVSLTAIKIEENTYILDTSSLTTGVYIVKLTTKDGTYQTRILKD